MGTCLGPFLLTPLRFSKLGLELSTRWLAMGRPKGRDIFLNAVFKLQDREILRYPEGSVSSRHPGVLEHDTFFGEKRVKNSLGFQEMYEILVNGTVPRVSAGKCHPLQISGKRMGYLTNVLGISDYLGEKSQHVMPSAKVNSRVKSQQPDQSGSWLQTTESDSN